MMNLKWLLLVLPELWACGPDAFLAMDSLPDTGAGDAVSVDAPGCDGDVVEDAGSDAPLEAANSDACAIGKLPECPLHIADGGPFYECLEWSTGITCPALSSPCSPPTSGGVINCASSKDCYGGPCEVYMPQIIKFECPAIISPPLPPTIECGPHGPSWTQVCQSDGECINGKACRPVAASKGVVALNFGICQ